MLRRALAFAVLLPLVITACDSGSGGGGDSVRPVVTLSVPAGTVASGVFSVRFQATDDVGVVSTTLLVDGVGLDQQSSNGAYALDTRAFTDGVHTVAVRASDGAGNTGVSETVSVTFRNDAQTLWLTSLTVTAYPPQNWSYGTPPVLIPWDPSPGSDPDMFLRVVDATGSLWYETPVQENAQPGQRWVLPTGGITLPLSGSYRVEVFDRDGTSNTRMGETGYYVASEGVRTRPASTTVSGPAPWMSTGTANVIEIGLRWE